MQAEEVLEKIGPGQKVMNGDYTDEDLSVLYALAHGLYQAGDYKEAKHVFLQLVSTKPRDPKYWLGYAAVLQMEKTYENAVMAWSVAAMLLQTDSTPHFHAAECLFSLGRKEQAFEALHEAEKLGSHLQDKIDCLKQQWASNDSSC